MMTTHTSLNPVTPMARCGLLAAALVTALGATVMAEQQPLTRSVQATLAGQSEYIIGPGDVLEIIVWDNAQVSRTVPVRPDGKISLPLVSEVTAAGLSPRQLCDLLNQSLAKFIEAPTVTVIVREVHSFKVSVLGQVRTPGKFEVTSHPTVLEALAMAGGLTEFADAGRIVVIRREGERTRTIPFAYNRLVTRNGNGGTQDNFLLQRDDVVLVR
jgi:polysaccharide export outer membrane protein